MGAREFTAKSVQEAIKIGLEAMDLGLDEADIEIVREGGTGIFGIGARKAVVRISPIDDDAFDPRTVLNDKEDTKETQKSFVDKVNDFGESLEKHANKLDKKANEVFEKVNNELDGKPKEVITKLGDKLDKFGSAAEEKLDPMMDKVGETINDLAQRTKAAGEAFASGGNKKRKNNENGKDMDPMVESPEHIEFLKNFLDGLFERMGITCTYKFSQKGETIQVDLKSEDSGRIIGHRGETLDSIQYLSRLAIHKTELDYRAVVVQTENYREKREQTLRALAKRLGNKVERTGSKVILEPMKPYERRIIHDTLQSNPKVTTTSEGVEPNRHVVILPK